MSVSDPLIKTLKGNVLKFLQDTKETNIVLDSNATVRPFCQNIEKVFLSGIVPIQYVFGITKSRDPWYWLEDISHIQDDIINFSYTSAVEGVKRYHGSLNNIGKTRLLIRNCLSSKSLHVPVEYLIKHKRYTLYNKNSILGDEILIEIFLSILLQCKKFNFNLDLTNLSFLSESWILPENLKIELVPCNNLGISVSFVGEKAIIVNIKPNSVVSENTKIQVGDVLDNLNGIHICLATKGKLNELVRNLKGQPITVQIIKARFSDTKQVYQPIIDLLKKVNIDQEVLKQNFNSTPDLNVQKNSSAGFKVTYIGFINVGKHGDVKQIDKAAKMLLTYPNFHTQSSSSLQLKHLKLPVNFEVGEIGVKVIESKTCDILLKHSYMEISSCGSISCMPHYFAYIAGNEYCDQATEFVCYVFSSKNYEQVYNILQSIGQGFHRTHYVV